MKSVKIRALAIVALILLLGLPSALTAQRKAEYEYQGEKARLEISETGELEWARDTDHFETPEIWLRAELDIDRVWQVEWTGYEHRHLVLGFDNHSDRREGVLHLVELRREPVSMKVLSTMRSEVDFFKLRFSAADKLLFLFDYDRKSVFHANFDASIGGLPEEEALEEIIDGSKLEFGDPAGISYYELDECRLLDLEPEGTRGLLLNRVDTGDFHPMGMYRVVRLNGHWEALYDKALSSWKPGLLSVSSSGPLRCFGPGGGYRLLRLDSADGPVEVARGTSAEKSAPYNVGIFRINLPAKGLVPGGRYVVVDPEEAEDYEKDLGGSREFHALFRAGRAFELDSLRLGRGQIHHRANLGMGAYPISIKLGSSRRRYWEPVVNVTLYWALATAEQGPPLEEHGEYALLQAQGAWSHDVRFEIKKPNRTIRWFPDLLDQRMRAGDLLYLQILATDGKAMALSGVFATTLFLDGEEPELDQKTLGEMGAVSEGTWQMAKGKLENR